MSDEAFVLLHITERVRLGLLRRDEEFLPKKVFLGAGAVGQMVGLLLCTL